MPSRPFGHPTRLLLLAPWLLTACSDEPAADPDPVGSTGATTAAMPTASGSSSGDATGGADESGPPADSLGGGDTTDAGSTGSPACAEPAGDPQQEIVSLTTSDGKAIAGIITRPATGSCLPAALLLHQFGNDKSQWNAHLPAFIAAGYVTLAIDLRGHGESDPQDGAFNDLLTDPDQAPLDVQAAIAHLMGDDAVDPARVGVVGTSIGANLAVVAASQDLGVGATVALSTRLTPVESLLGGAAVSLGPLLCYAGETDGGGDQAMTCAALEPLSSGPAQSVILPDTGAHGVAIVDGFPETVPAIIDFLDANL